MSLILYRHASRKPGEIVDIPPRRRVNYSLTFPPIMP